MIDVFVSYAREDQQRVEPLVDWLQACGFEIWWDKRISPGTAFDSAIEDKLHNTKAVLVVWSEYSVNSNWVQTEANEGMELDKLVPVLIDDIKPPLAFRRIQAAPLTGFPDQYDQAALSQLRRALAELTEKTLPSPAEPPPTKTPKRYWSLAAGLLAAIALFYFWPSQTTQAIPAQFSFTAFGATQEQETDVYAALADEIAFGLQRDVQISVTSADPRALPSGYLVTGVAQADALEIVVHDTANEQIKMQQSYPLSDGLAAVNDQISRDLAALVNRPSQQKSYSNPQAYREFLLSSALLRQTPTTPRLLEAQAKFAALVNDHPRFARAYARLCSVELLLYRALVEEQWFNAAERHCHRALTLDESDWEVMLSLSGLYRTSGQADKALDMAERAAQQHPNSGTVQRELGVIQMVAGNDDLALTAYQRALKNEPGYWRNYMALGEFYFRKGQYDQAAYYYTQEVERVRDKAMSLNNLASAFYMQGEQQAAITAWQESIAEEPTINALLNLGSASFFAEDFADSVHYYQQAQTIAPEDQRIAGHIADALAADNQPSAKEAYEGALQLALTALRINPQNIKVNTDVAAYYAALQQQEPALRHLKLGQTEQATVDEVYDRVLVFLRLGLHDKAAVEQKRLADMGYPQHLIDADANLRE